LITILIDQIKDKQVKYLRGTKANALNSGLCLIFKFSLLNLKLITITIQRKAR